MTITEALERIYTTVPVSSEKPVKYNKPFPLDSTTITPLTLLGYAASMSAFTQHQINLI